MDTHQTQPNHTLQLPSTATASRHRPFSSEQRESLCAALLYSFDRDALVRLFAIEFNTTLENKVALHRRNTTDIVLDVVNWSLARPDIGPKGMIAAALRQIPKAPKLAALQNEWIGITFDLSRYCPYPGMRPYGQGQSEVFFGRTDESMKLEARIAGQPLVVVIGPSGSGKSSLIQAGLLPQLSDDWQVCTMTPGSNPLSRIHELLTPYVDSSEWRNLTTPSRPVLVIVDQFEELFTQARSQADAFGRFLVDLMRVENVHILIALRADFFEHLMTSPIWSEAEDRMMPVLPLSRDGMKSAICLPAEAVGVKVADDCVERLLNDAAGEPGVLPFLQETLVLLWSRLTAPEITLADSEQLAAGLGGTRNGIQAAMALRADEVFASIGSAHPNFEKKQLQAIAARCFMRMVTVVSAGRSTRRQQSEAELLAVGDDASAVQAVLQHLVTGRLLTTSSKPGGGSPTYDLAHDALIAGWPRYAEWIDQLMIAEEERRRLEGKAAEHKRLGTDSALLDLRELQEAEAYLHSEAGRTLGASQALLDLAQASRKAINPGWNPTGTAILGGLVVSIALWLGFLYLATFSLGNAAQIAVWLSIAVVVVGLIVWLWLGYRKRTHWLEHITQQLGNNAAWRFALGLSVIGAVAGYMMVGVPLTQKIGQCQAKGINFAERGILQVGLVAQGIDPYNASVIQRILDDQARLRAFYVSAADAAECDIFFQHIVAIETAKASTGEDIFVTSIDDGRASQQPRSQDTSCHAAGRLAYEIVAAIDPESGIALVDGPSAYTSVVCKAWVLNNDGYAALRAGDLDRAEALLEQAIAEQPDFAAAYLNLGDVYYSLGQTDDSLEMYEQALSLENTNPRYQHKVASVYHQLWRIDFSDDYFDRAESHYQSAIELDADYVEPRSSLANLYILGAVNLEDAQQLLDAATAILDTSPVYSSEDRAALRSLVLKNYGIMAYTNGDVDMAIAKLIEADALSNVYDLDILSFLVGVYFRSDRQQEACSTLKRLEELILSTGDSPSASLIEALSQCSN